MSQTTQAAEETLSRLRKRRSTPACYPCFKRKVKCRGGRPCEACTERGHPDICHIEQSSKGSRRHPKGKIQRSSIVQGDTPGSIGNESNVGELSAVNFVQDNLAAREGKNDAFHVMGMRTSGFPISLITLGGTVHDTNDQAPLRAEVLQYYSAFRDLVMPLYPVVPDPLSLEVWIAELLQKKHTQLDPGKLAVILSSLALGTQFTEANVDNRWEISQNFISRASTYLQRANCIFEPSTEVVQSLLMIGIGLQNLGLSHGAWNLLGLTYRCAQSLGLQNCTCDDEPGYRGSMLWTAVTWQDALISLRYDRAPLTDDEQEVDFSTHATYCFPPYYDMVNKLCRASRILLRQPTTRRHNIHYISSRVNNLENIVATAREHLNPQYTARTLQQKFQYYAFRVHSSLLIAEFCRPSFSITEAENDNAHKAIRQKALHHLFGVVESFLQLCTFSNVPLRLWSLTQAAVSCGLVLALLVTKKSCPKAQPLLQRMIDVLRLSDSSNSSSEVHSNATVSEIYGMHSKTATVLESLLSRHDHISSPSARRQSPPTSVENGAVGTGPEYELFAGLAFEDYLNWPSELSLFDNTFSDSLLQANSEESFYNDGIGDFVDT